MPKPKFYSTDIHPKTLIIGINTPYNTSADIQSYFNEFIQLINTSGLTYDHELYITLREIDPSYFFTKGKRDEIKALCERENIEEIILSEPLTSMQERNVCDLFGCLVFDRTRLILDIFEKAAQSAEGKLQVQIAKLQHLKTRLAGKGIFFSQQAGNVGARGPGETQKERESRHIEKTILQAKHQLEKIQNARQTQRKKRLANKVPLICLIGYTNAGKSTILNTLTRSNVVAENKLFATLDTTSRALFIDGKQKGILSDTVGFIQQLPHQLIEAFKSTLSELQYADLLLHVVDVSDKNWQVHIVVVNEILNELQLQKDMLYVFNKIDNIELTPSLIDRINQHEPHVLISSISKQAIQPLLDYLHSWNPPQ